MRNWSTQQQAIFGWFEQPTGSNLIVRARAGTGKTTTIIEGINRAKDATILLCAFNKRIAEELTTRVTNHAVAKTLHSIGFSIVQKYWEGLRVAKGTDRADDLTARVTEATAPDAIKRLVTKLHSKAREIKPLAESANDLTDLAFTFECVPDERWAGTRYDLGYVTAAAYKAMVLAAAEKPVRTGIDFADMIFLPVRNKWVNPAYDLVVVDEAQDMTVAQLMIARGICKGRIAVVGDDRQAIYGFRGADSGSLDRLKTELNATELGLTVTYRCGRVIVEEARTMVPDFTAGPDNPEGTISDCPMEKLTEMIAPGDFLLSRKNAPLVEVAMKLLRDGKRARIAGRDVGAGLKAIIRRLAKGPAASSLPALIDKITVWSAREQDKMVRAKRQDKADLIADQADMILNLAGAARSVADIEARIDALFTDDGLGQAGVITCSSVHRAKGLEADRVFILASTLMSGGIEEENIKYVAITRAKKEVVWVA